MDDGSEVKGLKGNQEVKVKITYTPGWKERFTEACCKEYIRRKEREALEMEGLKR